MYIALSEAVTLQIPDSNSVSRIILQRKIQPENHMLLTSLLLGAIWKLGNSIGPILCWVFVLLMTIELVYVWIKYVIKSDK